MKRSDNYRDRVVQKVDYNPNRRESEDYANDAEAEQIASRGGGGGGGSRAMNRTSGVDKFVRVPVPVPAAFDYAPQSNVIGGEARRMPDQMRKMQNKMRNKKK